jgi:protein-S-isoprenylcysteine O-methyltransferase Ste14
MKDSDTADHGEARFVFRVLAGIISVLMLLSLPFMVFVAFNWDWQFWLGVLGCLISGTGFAGAAWTGRWFCFRKKMRQKPPNHCQNEIKISG